jgi:hypothetical protein
LTKQQLVEQALRDQFRLLYTAFGMSVMDVTAIDKQLSTSSYRQAAMDKQLWTSSYGQAVIDKAIDQLLDIPMVTDGYQSRATGPPTKEPNKAHGVHKVKKKH